MKRWVVVLFLSFMVAGCGKKKKDKYGKGSVSFGNSTSTTLAETKPTALSVKLKYIILAEDKENATAETGYNGNNKGQGARLWAAEKCSSYTKDEDTGAEYGDIKSDAECNAAGLGYFDLNRTSSAVNTELNSQEAKVLPGTYRYVGLALLGEQAGGNNTYTNVKWSYTDGAVTDKEFATIQTEWSAKIDPPLEIAEEQTAVLTLSYSLDKVVTNALTNASVKERGSGINQPGKYDDCNTAKTVCMNVPTLSVSVTKK